jgi:HD-GYP domain-containing protein (c-di-GMP phosphodiesterase class II)
MSVLSIHSVTRSSVVAMGTEPERLTRAELLAALSTALDMTEGLPAGHSRRSAWIALRIADIIHLPESQRSDLFYAVLLKDIGCSSNASRLFNLYGMDDIALKADFRRVDSEKLLQIFRFIITHTRPDAPLTARMARALHIGIHAVSLAREVVEDRCHRGREILEKMGFPSGVSDAVGSLDEHWDGHGLPQKLTGKNIPLLSRLALLAQVADVFFVAGGPVMATQEVCRRSGTWFDPNVVRAFVSASSESDFWTSLENGTAADASGRFDESNAGIVHDAEVDRLVAAFSEVIDAKSPWTAGHSRRVADVADAIASTLRLPANQRLWIRRASLLHDIGKLGLGNSILEQTKRLSEVDQRRYREHVIMSRKILSGIRGFAPILPLVEAHHERFDGTGFPLGLAADQIPPGAQILAVADQFDWLLCGPEPVPSSHHALSKLSEQRGTLFAPAIVDALAQAVLAGHVHAPLPR